MAGKKRISINAIERITGKAHPDTVDITWNDIDITIRRTIGFGEMVKFVNEAVNSCFSENGAYNPEAEDFAVMLNVIEKYTNITLPDNIEAQYAFIYRTDIIDTVKQYIDMRQYGVMTRAIEEKVRHRAQANIEAILKQMKDVSAAIDGVQAQMTEQLSAALGDVDPSDIAKLAGSMADGGLDEEKIVKAYLEHSYASVGEETT